MVASEIMQLSSDALRSVLVASPGRKLVMSDLSNIEGRALPWLAYEEWKLQAFRDYDHGIGPDLYKVAYGRSFNVDPADVDDGDQRQIGKVQELALGYQGGVGAFVSMAASLGIDLDELAAGVLPTLSRKVFLDATNMWNWAKSKRRTLGLEQEVFTACEALKSLWREAHPMIEGFWLALEVAAKSAILNKGIEYTAGRITFDRQGAWLRMRLPSGRYLLYPNPIIRNETVHYAAWNVYTKSWVHEGTYGGKFAENATQAVARDILAFAYQPAEDAGYPIVLTVHDELVTEPLDAPEFNAETLSAILADNPDWAAGLPLAAKGFESQRYRKG